MMTMASLPLEFSLIPEQKVPVIGGYFINEIPASDNVSILGLFWQATS